jgi:hypothetical protein
MIRSFNKAVALLGVVILAFAVASCDAPSGDADNSAFVGKYMTMDTQGQEMTITLDDDGSASGSRAEESLSGSWKEEGNAAVITWSDNWTTKIAKDGDKYMKTAYKDGSQDGDAVAAEKVD